MTTPETRRTPWLGILVIAGGAAGLFWLTSRPAAPPQRLASPPAPRTTAPTVAAQPVNHFVGLQRCSECHAEEARSFAGTGHANTFASSRELPDGPKWNGRSFLDSERDQTFRYVFDASSGLAVSIDGKFGGRTFPLEYVLGSGFHARTFLSLIPAFDGSTRGLEHRVSAFAPDGALGITPSHPRRTAYEDVELFGKVEDPATTERCIGCHTTQVEFSQGRFRATLPNVQCESCHGPGGKHLESVSRKDSELAIQALRATTAADSRAQIDRCGVCHRLPANFQPHELQPDNTELARFQPVGILNSKCFTASSGMLSCTSCHDPHAPRTAQPDPVASCVKCHSAAVQGSAVCHVSTTDCVKCHMPKVELYPGISFHDHWIRIRPQRDP